MKKWTYTLICLLFCSYAQSQHSVARQWNEVILEGIRNDYARPTVHARNLFHTSAAMYDSWAVFEPTADTYFLGNTQGGFQFDFGGIEPHSNIELARTELLSYACYRLIHHRFKYSPNGAATLLLADQLMDDLELDKAMTSEDYSNGSAAALGNYLAAKIIAFGFQDDSNEQNDYENLDYLPVNDAMIVQEPGSQGIQDPNRWQPLAFNTFIDQSGNEIPGSTPDFLSPEWGNVVPFCLTENELSADAVANEYPHDVYMDPGPPAYIDMEDDEASQDYKWGFSLVSIWSSHLDTHDPTRLDISPASLGHLDINKFPKKHSELPNFYNQLAGGDPSIGYDLNPKTNQPYPRQEVLRGDYTRVLAEFWADGPDSETPPGHWFTILNYVNDHPELVKKFKGQGAVLSDLEWDVKSYFALAGGMHDAAISAWSVKGYYDYVRPVSAIRFMAEKGQSSDASLANYHTAGIPLVEGFIALIEENDPLAGEELEHVGKIKLYAWKGHDYIPDPETDVAGVGWILAEEWLPYQRSSFVTPPFAGYVSGHSTFSRAAAQILTAFTGDEYFPGGVGEFVAKKNEFLVFEAGPSEDVTLQWAKYYDASDQCSLSRIWGGIHPPADDINGRLMGQQIGEMAFSLAEQYFSKDVLSVEQDLVSEIVLFPNPSTAEVNIIVADNRIGATIEILSLSGQVLEEEIILNNSTRMNTAGLKTGVYFVRLKGENRLMKWIKI
ncbi:MAG: T9SS type A sorting domain-containing protein [Reichenbachiella sp.]